MSGEALLEASTRYGVLDHAKSAYGSIRAAIESGRFASGSRLSERKLGQELGLSRTPIRAALHRLDAEGFVEIIPRFGAFVRKLDAREARELFEVRRALEAAATGAAAERITAEQAEELVALGTKVDRLSAQGDQARYAEADMEFHLSIVALSGNGTLQRLMKNLRGIFSSLWAHQTIKGLPGASEEESRRETIHRDVAEAVGSGDARGAFETMWRHFDYMERILAEHCAREKEEQAGG